MTSPPPDPSDRPPPAGSPAVGAYDPFANAPVPLWTADHRGLRADFNRAWEDFTGASAEAGRGDGWLATVHGDDRERVAQAWREAIERDAEFVLEFRSVRADGSYHWVRERAHPRRGSAGELLGFVGSTLDVTQEHEARAEATHLAELLRHARRREAIGHLAEGLANELGNALVAIGGYGELLEQELEPGDPRHPHVAEIRAAAERAGALCRQLSAIGSPGARTPTPCDVSAVVSSLEELLSRTLGDGVTLRVEELDEGARVLAERRLIEQALVHLVLNAREATEGSGEVEIAVEANCAGPPGDEQRHVRITVRDDGHGMDAGTLPRVTEPFFTTKDPDEHSGLGLTTVRSIAEHFGGTLTVHSEKGAGCTVVLSLPQADEPAAGASAGPAAKVLAETILVVEDDADVLTLLCDVLRRFGYEVLTARDGLEALVVCDAHPGPIHLVISDVMMPRMGGPELVERLAALRPRAQVLFVSGYTGDVVLPRSRNMLPWEFLHKPFTLQQLTEKVRALLSR